MKRIFVVFILICIVLISTSCSENDKLVLIKYETNDGILLEYEYVWNKKDDLVLPVPIKENYKFLGWYPSLLISFKDSNSYFAYKVISSIPI